MKQPTYWQRWGGRRVSRRAVLRSGALAGVGGAALALVGCGGDDDDTPEETEQPEGDQPSEPQEPVTPPEEEEAPAAEEPEAPERPTGPVAGGVAQLTSQTGSHDRWDPHRSRFSQTQLWHSLMYNRLIRWDSISAGTLEGDLAQLPEMVEDDTYIFTIKPDAKFWDREPTQGRAVLAEDVRFNLQRQIEGLDAAEEPDPLFYRRAKYSRTADIEVTGARTIVLKTDGPDATYLTSVHAAPWAWLTSPEAVEEFGDRWRDKPNNVDLNSGTGPYVPVSFTPGGELVLRRSTNWWKPDSAFVDGWRLRAIPTPALPEAYRTGAIDAVDFPLGNRVIEDLGTDRPDHVRFETPLQSPIQLVMSFHDAEDNPYRDPRVARALHLAVNRFALIDELYQGDGRLSGPVPWFFPAWAIPEGELTTVPGFRPDKADDLEEVQGLLAAAQPGRRLPLVLPDLLLAAFPGIDDTIQAMLERNLGLDVRIEHRTYQEIETGLTGSTLPAFIGLGPIALQPQEADPTAFWLRTAHSEGRENWGGYVSPEVDDLLDQMRVTFAEAERRDLALRVQALMLGLEPFWMQNVTHGIQIGLHWPYYRPHPRGLEFAWAGSHLDKAWIDTTDEQYPADRALPEEQEA